MHTTTDISLATALICIGYELDDCKKVGYTQVEFVLKPDGHNIEDDLKSFYNRDLPTDALTLFETHKSLKGRASDLLRRG